MEEKSVVDGKNGQFIYYFQPIISTDRGRVSDLEALVRFETEDGEIIAPGAFIPQMEAEGSIDLFTRLYFPLLVQSARSFCEIDPQLRLSFNLSSQSLQIEDCAAFLLQVLDQQEVKPSSMQLEVLETGLLQQNQIVEENLKRLSAAGMIIAMDDYGTGYSSIDTLSLWPFSSIKLDRDLIKRMLNSQKATTIVETSILMAHQLGITVVAEGIEHQAQYRFLTSSGCDKLQGFWIARPMPMEHAVKFVQDKQSKHDQCPPVGLIMQAQMDHLEWRRRLIQELESIQFESESGQPRVAHRTPELNHHHCRFGGWYYSSDESYTEWEEFQALRQPHREFHQLANQLISHVKEGKKDSRLMALLAEMDEKTIEMVILLQRLEMRSFLFNESGGASEN
ncbi:MAG: EAL domain-containing protein [Gammaproteobacteria bacterium]|jgi:EAL domain-containing protein (putative c-di-GMP-specific phosphodiesterase class I)|nr:EAL domain-containing protein [Gammaproteobacteria bacterium]MBT3490056.1 EAL domain-containing protein [Gammaproteobacteria bacterium]MBT3719478.1 EAL domain-containing protein [Gammaproteobacteria bacterium]MBT3843990.1 EAL domain-containing protein [Gammaproteobacteria bacterium]MBT3893951.1 EAL domain-containing protein [Gammaproteobacteria bacterium]